MQRTYRTARKLPLRKRSQRLPVSGKGDDADRYFRCWNCGFICDSKRDHLGGENSAAGDNHYDAALQAGANYRAGIGERPVGTLDVMDHYHTALKVSGFDKTIIQVDSTTNEPLELVNNGGFELGAGNTFTGWSRIWSENDTVTQETTLVNGGIRAVKITYVDGITDTQIYYFGSEGYNLEWTPGDTVHWEFYTRGDGSVSGFYSIYDRNNSADIVAKTSTGISGTTYTKIYGSFTAPGGCTLGRVFFYAPTSAGSVYYDDVSFTVSVSVPTVISYADGTPEFVYHHHRTNISNGCPFCGSTNYRGDY